MKLAEGHGRKVASADEARQINEGGRLLRQPTDAKLGKGQAALTHATNIL